MTFELSNYKDVDNVVLSIIDEYYRLRDSGDNDGAFKYLKKYESVLKPYKIDCSSFNKIELGIYNLAKEIYYSQKIIISPTEPDTDKNRINNGSEWLKEY